MLPSAVCSVVGAENSLRPALYSSGTSVAVVRGFRERQLLPSPKMLQRSAKGPLMVPEPPGMMASHSQGELLLAWHLGTGQTWVLAMGSAGLSSD